MEYRVIGGRMVNLIQRLANIIISRKNQIFVSSILQFIVLRQPSEYVYI